MTRIYKTIISLSLLVFILSLNTFSQEARVNVNATVADAEGNPIASAIVYGGESNKMIFTDENGMFSVEATASGILVIEADGFEPTRIDVSEIGQNEKIILSTKPFHFSAADEVNVAFGTMKKRQIVGAVDVLNTSEINKYDDKQGVLEAIRGRVPGMFGMDNIRGLGHALIVVDGVPRSSTAHGSNFDLIASYNLQEIEQITVLKDASSRMLYGAQADQGVILITTKRGEAYKRKFGVRLESGINSPISYPKFLDAADYMMMYNQASANDGIAPKYSSEEIANTRSGADPIRYPDESFYNSTYLKNNSSFFRLATDASGGNDFARYYSNITWDHSNDLYALEGDKGYASDRINFTGNVDYNVNDWLKANLDARFVFTSNRQPVGDFWADAATHLPNSYPMLIPASAVQDSAIIQSSKLINGESLLGGTNQYTNNIYGNFVLGGYQTFTQRVSQVNLGLDFDLGKITQGLTAKTKLSYDVLNSYVLSYNNDYAVYERSYVPSSTSGDSLVATRIGVDEKTQTQTLSGDNKYYEHRYAFFGTLDYHRIFDGKHAVYGTALAYLDKVVVPGELHAPKRKHYALRGNYMYDNRLIAEVTGTLTGSPYLPDDNRYQVSHSIGLGWIVSEESFLEGSDFVNYLKLKGSYGKVLTDNGFPRYFISRTSYGTGDQFYYNNGAFHNRARQFVNLANTDIDLLASTDFNIGLEAFLADNRVFIEANYFNSTLSNKIVKRENVYPVYYAELQYENYEKDRDSGIDLGVTLKNKRGDFRYSLGLNAMYVLPKVIAVDELINPNAPYQQMKGEPYDAILGYVAEGLFKDATDVNSHASQAALGTVVPGDIKYKDLNNDGVIDLQDRKIIGNSRSRLSYGINVSLSYKNFSLFALGTGENGGERFFDDDYYWQVGQTAKYSEVVLDSWTSANPNNAKYPILHLNSANNNYQNSTYWIEKNNWFRLHTVQLSYNVAPNKIPHVKGMQVYVRGNNLTTISPIKDKLELNIGNAPQMRSYSVGLDIMF